MGIEIHGSRKFELHAPKGATPEGTAFASVSAQLGKEGGLVIPGATARRLDAKTLTTVGYFMNLHQPDKAQKAIDDAIGSPRVLVGELALFCDKLGKAKPKITGKDVLVPEAVVALLQKEGGFPAAGSLSLDVRPLANAPVLPPAAAKTSVSVKGAAAATKADPQSKIEAAAAKVAEALGSKVQFPELARREPDPARGGALVDVAAKPIGVPRSEYSCLVASGSGFTIADGKKPAEAVKAFMEHPERYVFDCAMAQQMFMFCTLYSANGEEKFNTLMEANGGFILKPGVFQGAIAVLSPTYREDPNFSSSARPPESAPGDASWLMKTARPGDAVYFDNPGVTDAGRKAGYQGENAIYLGGGKYWAHPFGICKEGQIIEELNAYSSGAKPVVRMEEYRRLQSF